MGAPKKAGLRHLCQLAAFLGFVLLPASIWAIRAPDSAYAPLPDYDIRKGYGSGIDLRDPRVAQELPLLRRQRAAKRALAAAVRPPMLPLASADEVTALFGEGVSIEWNANGTPRYLAQDEGWLAPPRAGADPVRVARAFLRAQRRFFRLSDPAVAALQVKQKNRSGSGAQHISFRQRVGEIPVFQGDVKVSLAKNNAVLSVGGTVFPELRVSGTSKLSAVEAAQAAARYVGPLTVGKKQSTENRLDNPGQPAPTNAAAGVPVPGAEAKGRRVEFTPKVIAAEASPEEKTTLTPGPFRREIRASRVVFPLSPTQGRQAWKVYLMKAPTEFYQIIVDAEDGALLSRTNLILFSQPQGLVFLLNPDAGSQVLRSFVGDPTASPHTFVNLTQSGTQGNNVVMTVGANDTAGPQHFLFPFTNDYETNGLRSFDLNGRTLLFTPNPSGGYDLSFPAFAAAPPGSNLFLFDDASTCLAPPTGFTFFGQNPSTVCVNSNGNLTMDRSDVSPIEDQLSLAQGSPRIMGLWHDFDPSAGGFVGMSTPASGQLCFRWNNVPEFGAINSNSFSICLFGSGSAQPPGTIQLSYPSVAAQFGMVGISPGNDRATADTGFSSTASTIGRLGLARVYPDHADSPAAATTLFWGLNEVGHDRTYAAGFVEAESNMQKDNFGRGGLENDSILAAAGFVVGGLFFNNAFFGTSPEGFCCPTTAFGLFTNPPFRQVDSAFDSDVVVHEHAHGLTTRMVGSLSGVQSGAMGEGWSDWYALSYANDPVVGEYSTGNATTGIRLVRYDNSSPRQLGQFGNILGPFTSANSGLPIQGSLFFPEVHADGEIWATMLAELRTTLLADGVSAATIERLVTEALGFTPPNPSMVSARKALLLARKQLKGQAGVNIKRCLMWDVFARRGFGKKAKNNEATILTGDSYSIFQAFNRPQRRCGGSFSKGTVLHKTSFENAAVGDTTADAWTGTGLWHVTAQRHAGTRGRKSFYFGSEASGSYDTGSQEQGTMTSPVLNLSAANRPVLEMNIFIDTEQLFPFDTLWVRLSTDGGATYPIQRGILFWKTFGGFQRVKLDLDPLRFQPNTRIQLYFDTFDALDNNFEGVYVDKVKVRNYLEQ